MLLTERRRLQRGWRDTTKRQGPGWKAQEAKLPKLQRGGKSVRGSGCAKGASSKGDSRGDMFLVSAKTTEKKSLRLERGWLEEIERQANNVRLQAMLCFGFDADDLASQGRVDWCAFPDGVAKTLIQVAEATLEGDHDRAKALAELLQGG